MHQNTSLNPIRQTVIYTFMTIGLFLFVFIGAKAVEDADDRKYVDGQRQQYVSGTRMPSFGTTEWLQTRSASTLNYQPAASVPAGASEQNQPKSNQPSKQETSKEVRESLREQKAAPVPEIIPAVKDRLTQ